MRLGDWVIKCLLGKNIMVEEEVKVSIIELLDNTVEAQGKDVLKKRW